MSHYSLVIRNGTIFDGSGSSPIRADLGIRGDIVATIGNIEPGTADREIDADGKWVIPGMIDAHTHYDAEVLNAPGIGESVRHGVTSVVIGNCSLSTVYADADDCADMFCRVEALPWEVVHGAVKENKTWSDARSYVAAINALPLGVNIAAFIGHSDIRATVMGFERATNAAVTPDAVEMDRMRKLLSDSLDAGFLGLSTIRSSFSKTEGSRWPARLLPSTHATWKEFGALNNVLRKRGRIHQSTPNLARRTEMARYFLQSMGRKRRPLKTTVISAVDPISDRFVAKAAIAAAKLTNKLGGDGFRWQHLPVPFDVWADGIDVMVFEEFGAGVDALNIRDLMKRSELLADEDYRRRFRKEMTSKGFKVWHRNLYLADIVECPDASLIGRTFGEIADDRGVEPADALLDLAVQYGKRLRWHTTVANDRENLLDDLQQSDVVQIGFADSGAHARNMAFFNFGVRMLERVDKRKFMSIERAVHRLTGELADWYGLHEVGYLKVGKRADVVVIDPAGFDGSSAEYAEAPMAGVDGIDRMVNRNDMAVAATVVGGHLLYEYGTFTEGFGTTIHAGKFLQAKGNE